MLDYSKNSIVVNENGEEDIVNGVIKVKKGDVLNYRNMIRDSYYDVNINGIDYLVVQTSRYNLYDGYIKRKDEPNIYTRVYLYPNDKEFNKLSYSYIAYDYGMQTINDQVNVELIEKVLKDFSKLHEIEYTYYYFSCEDGLLRVYNNLKDFRRDKEIDKILKSDLGKTYIELENVSLDVNNCKKNISYLERDIIKLEEELKKKKEQLEQENKLLNEKVDALLNVQAKYDELKSDNATYKKM